MAAGRGRYLETCASTRLIDRRDRALLLLGLASAPRRSELAALTVADLDFVAEGVKLAIRAQQDRPGGRRPDRRRGCHRHSDLPRGGAADVAGGRWHLRGRGVPRNQSPRPDRGVPVRPGRRADRQASLQRWPAPIRRTSRRTRCAPAAPPRQPHTGSRNAILAGIPAIARSRCYAAISASRRPCPRAPRRGASPQERIYA
jgi:hypothetical protein